MATGGPNEYDGKNMSDAHKGRGITDLEFDLVCKHVITTMQDLKVPEPLQEEVKNLLLPLRKDVTQAWEYYTNLLNLTL